MENGEEQSTLGENCASRSSMLLCLLCLQSSACAALRLWERRGKKLSVSAHSWKTSSVTQQSADPLCHHYRSTQTKRRMLGSFSGCGATWLRPLAFLPPNAYDGDVWMPLFISVSSFFPLTAISASLSLSLLSFHRIYSWPASWAASESPQCTKRGIASSEPHISANNLLFFHIWMCTAALRTFRSTVHALYVAKVVQFVLFLQQEWMKLFLIGEKLSRTDIRCWNKTVWVCVHNLYHMFGSYPLFLLPLFLFCLHSFLYLLLWLHCSLALSRSLSLDPSQSIKSCCCRLTDVIHNHILITLIQTLNKANMMLRTKEESVKCAEQVITVL